MPKGTVKWFDNKKGYGFIKSEDGKDIFVHQTQILSEGYRTLKENQPVEFEVEDSAKGPHATQVSPVK